VAKIIYSENALVNLERVFQFLVEQDRDAALTAARSIRDAVETLSDHPLIGRRVTGDLRELVISFGSTGYIALYRFMPRQDVVRILALRHQRELDFFT
jgi:plasmid stabilization system protein ParE